MKSFLRENRLLLWGALSFALASIVVNAIVHALHVRF